MSGVSNKTRNINQIKCILFIFFHNFYIISHKRDTMFPSIIQAFKRTPEVLNGYLLPSVYHIPLIVLNRIKQFPYQNTQSPGRQESDHGQKYSTAVCVSCFAENIISCRVAYRETDIALLHESGTDLMFKRKFSEAFVII